MEKDKSYNGFTNYETWAVSLRMANDWPSYDHYRALARQVRDIDQPKSIGHLTRDESAAMALAEIVRAEFEDASPVCKATSVYADLMHAALAEVNWYELAEELLNDIREDEAP